MTINTNTFKSGYAAIIGMPNVGKSTLVNTIVGQKIAIISDKPQTTRNKILAIYTTDEAQIVFTDTPGIHKPKTRLGEYMVSVANESVNEMDVVLFVVDASQPIHDMEREIARNIGRLNVPNILVINKIDKIKKEELLPLIADYSNLNKFDAIIPISAETGDGVKILLNEITDFIEPGPKFYYDDMVTDQPERQIAAEIIREKMLWTLNQEVPHGIAIEIEKMEEKETITNISANIYCEKNSHKGIIIGRNGEMLKRIGSLARSDIQKLLDQKVYLDLWVKVRPDWRNNNRMIRNFGYDVKE